MTDIGVMTPLKRIVAMALDEANKSTGDWERYWVLAFRALVHMTYQVSGSPVTEIVPVQGNKTANLPTHCLSWTKIGIGNERGEIVTLRINNGLNRFKAASPNRLSETPSDVTNGYGVSSPYYANFNYNGGVFQLFGVGGGMENYGSCTVDEAARVIILSPDFSYDHLYVEFIDIPEKNSDYMVPTCLTEAVIAFIKWKDKLGPGVEFYAAVTEGRRALPKKKVTVQSIHQLVRESDAYKLRS